LILVTSRQMMQPSFEAALEAALQDGAPWIQLREKDLTPSELSELACRAQQLCARYGTLLSINVRADVAHGNVAQFANSHLAHFAGVHVPEHGLAPHQARAMLHDSALVGQSVHGVQAAQRATAQGADYLVFGSVFPTNSHPDSASQGLRALHEITTVTHLPVYAIGGIDASRIPPCLDAGAHGVAVLSAAWQSGDVSEAVYRLVQAVEEFTTP
jgi:thiamine-phosphate pyrophosphorylase